ncbi:methyl-accepting chemotaxis protein [Caulobacter vibrioides]|uniref:Methyl-accepting chemotaxis protein n=2 Tax=Caulobacter vibrioides TaxID=155892 RepID=A0A290MPM0_CAUVI|nr:methyl-accepting chemotaxis protein [Caulobacter vibrioides]
MKRIRLVDLPLIIKIGFAPAFALLMLAVMAGGAIVVQKSQSAALQQVVENDMRQNLEIERISKRISNINGELFVVMTHKAGNIDVDKNDARMAAVLAETDAVKKDLLALKSKLPAAEQPKIAELIKSLEECRSAIDTVSGMIGVDFNMAAGFIAPFEEQYAKMTGQLDQVVAAANKRVEAETSKHQAEATAAMSVTIIMSLLTLATVGALAFLTVMTTRKSINDIAAATDKLSKGDNGIDLEKLTRGDELGAIVTALKVFRDNQLHLEQLRADQEKTAALTADERRAKEAAAAAQEASLVVSNLAEGLEKLASGDLTFRVTADFPGDYRKLKDDFNAAMGSLQETMKVIAASTDGLRTGADEIAHASDDLSRRTEQQAASLEQTAAALDELTATVRRTAAGARQASDVVSTTRGEATHSGQVVHQAVSAMGEIEKSSGQISQIIGVIDEIAFQTNLLALNAGVEAARAGEAGRGFAVVAQEVRALAQRSAEAAKEIKTLISSSTQQVSQGVSLVGQTGEALQRIVTKVGEIDALVTEIAASAAEQATGLNEVNTAVNQMDQVTQQNAAMVEQSTAATHSLKGETGELVRLMARFQVGGGSSSYTRPAVADAGQHAPARNPVAEQQARLNTFARPGRSSGSAAVAQAPAADGWEEF